MSDGSPYVRFKRALLTKNTTIITAAARDLPVVSLADALSIVLVFQAKRDPRADRAAAKWAARVILEKGLGVAQSHQLLGALTALPEDDTALEVVLRDYV
jgi:hypothetical protein